MSAHPSTHIWVIATTRWRRHGARLTTRIRQRRWSRRRARIALGLAVMLAAFIVAPAAFAADAQGGGNPWLNPFAIKDSSGLTVDQYALSLGGDDGFSGQAVADAVSKILALLLWDLYRLCVAIGLWILDWGLRMEVVSIMTDGATKFAAALSTAIGRLAVVSTLMAAAAVYFIHAVNRGQLAKGLVAFLTSFLMAALVQSPHVNAIDTVAGKDGAIMHSRDLGMAMAVDITTAGQETGPKDEETLRRVTVAKIADVVLRVPHQLINYGAVMDEKCRPVYDEVVKAGAGTDEARKKVGDCNEAYKRASDSPMQAATGLFFVGPGGGFVVAFGVILALGLALMCAISMFEAAGFTWQLLKAVVPGPSRSHVFESLAVVGICLITIIGVIFGVGLFVVIIDAVFEGNSNPVVGFVLLDITLAMASGFALVAFIKARSRGQHVGRSVAAGLSPGSSSSERAQPLRQLGQLASGAAAATWALRRGHSAGSGTGAAAAAGDAPQPSAAERLQHKLGQGAKVTAQAAGFALKSTVGAPVYAPRAVGAIKTAASARKAATTTKLAAARAKAGQQGQAARDFGAEYVGNLAASGRWVRRSTAAATDRVRGRESAYGPEAAAGPGVRTRTPRTSPPPSSFPTNNPTRSSSTAGTGASRPSSTPDPAKKSRPGRGRRGPVTVESLTREAGLQPGAQPDNAAQRLRDRVRAGTRSKS